MREIKDIQELRRIQIGILDNVDEFCNQHNIDYTLIAGTLIGAIRHKGYIPWDDDIDIMMTRKNYEKFLSIYNKEQQQKGSEMFLMDPKTKKDYKYNFGKVVDTRTIMQEEEVSDSIIGVYIDIFVADYVWNNYTLRKIQFFIKHILDKMFRCKVSNSIFLKSKVANFCYKYFPLPLCAVRYLIKKFLFSNKPSSYVCDMQTPFMTIDMVFKAEAMNEYITATFEGKKYKIMKGYDMFLRARYDGDYMQLPPVEERVQHKFKAWWK